jgi:hypothetical protein
MDHNTYTHLETHRYNPIPGGTDNFSVAAFGTIQNPITTTPSLSHDPSYETAAATEAWRNDQHAPTWNELGAVAKTVIIATPLMLVAFIGALWF